MNTFPLILTLPHALSFAPVTVPPISSVPSHSTFVPSATFPLICTPPDALMFPEPRSTSPLWKKISSTSIMPEDSLYFGQPEMVAIARTTPSSSCNLTPFPALNTGSFAFGGGIGFPATVTPGTPGTGNVFTAITSPTFTSGILTDSRKSTWTSSKGRSTTLSSGTMNSILPSLPGTLVRPWAIKTGSFGFSAHALMQASTSSPYSMPSFFADSTTSFGSKDAGTVSASTSSCRKFEGGLSFSLYTTPSDTSSIR